MTRETLDGLFDSFDNGIFTQVHPLPKDRAFAGLLIINKYLPHDKNRLIDAEHDNVYGPYVDDLLDAGLSNEDAYRLVELGWRVDDDTDSFYVLI